MSFLLRLVLCDSVTQRNRERFLTEFVQTQSRELRLFGELHSPRLFVRQTVVCTNTALTSAPHALHRSAEAYEDGVHGRHFANRPTNLLFAPRPFTTVYEQVVVSYL